MATLVERLATLEANHANMVDDVAEIKKDVKLLVADRNQQRGGIKVALATGGLVGGIVSAGIAYFTSKG